MYVSRRTARTIACRSPTASPTTVLDEHPPSSERQRAVTTFASPQDSRKRLDELDALVRDAWEQYQAEVQLLDGNAYAIAEPAAWDALQLTLTEVETERSSITTDLARVG